MSETITKDLGAVSSYAVAVEHGFNGTEQEWIDLITGSTNSATSARNSSTLAQSWAVGGTNSRNGEDTNNAKYYAEQAQSSSENLDWANVNNKPSTISGYGISNAYTKTEVDSALSDKVDKVTGKGLSENDYTTAEKTKLEGIESGAEANAIETVKVGGTALVPDANKAVNISSVPASLITGTIDLANLPQGSLERLVTVADLTAMYALTTATVQNGDVVRTNDTGTMYYVVDDTHLDSILGYKVFTAGTASSVPWTGVTDKPTTVSGYGITDAYTKTEVDTSLSGKVEKVTGKGLSTNDYTNADKTIVDGVTTALSGKVDKVTGKQLSTEDYTTAEKTKLDGIETGAEVNAITGVKGDSESSYRTGNVNITKTNIGLGNVDNTSDLNKPISTATQDALTAVSGDIASHMNDTSNPHAVTSGQVGYNNANSTLNATNVKSAIDELSSNINILSNQSGEDAMLALAVNGSNTTQLFWSWYNEAKKRTPSQTKYQLLDRFFTALANGWNNKTYTLRWQLHGTSNDSTMTPMDNLVGKTSAPLCTDADTNVSVHWTDEDPMYWYIRINALSLADGTMNVLAIEGEDAFDITGAIAPVYTVKMAKWVKIWNDENYNYISWRATKANGYKPYAGDVGVDNQKRSLTWLPTFGGGLDPTTGGLTSGAGLAPYTRASATTGITKARITSTYEGLWNDCDTIALLHDWQFRHFNLENSNILEGCLNFNYQYTVALAENGVKRILLTSAQAANLPVGCGIQLGTHPEGTNTDRNTAANYNLITWAKVLSQEEVTIDGTTYTALNLDIPEDIDVPSTAYVSSAPWESGTTEALPWHKDGSIKNLTNGRYPIRVGGVEALDGAYAIGLDPLYQVSAGSDATHWNYKIYECKNSEKLSGSITSDYVDTGITYADMPQGWNYVKRFVKTTLGILFPDIIGGSSSGWFKSAFYGTSSSGVRCPWRFGSLIIGAFGGLSCESGTNPPSYAYWHGRPRLSGSGKKRGEWSE